ncbi:nucleoside triphosphate pyrophosphohydrolase [Clostridium botulinum]|uniref:Nucleotide pyrophosphohydrolase n=1 Tax=Clostridium botulinum C/D str. DC5 TaxID=1443128 RepID=A0A0A0I5D3_CLOBO|nr:nucleoside triphosphate pyrophosphohydrolase [Clostridium botulinum]KGM96052.1 nucleotide pyrophosphohydrolase [Clostridium botulinum C/D str. DC5]KGM96735.1 nucleotide pyrophosphohydrolase [Clostridium botulinum D str. CCUG 7971]KOC51259.1 nucleotide pyrophosphohydrolase [Clostridium botulinum]KOC54982.1 nucleotide pyrophosphohydrolase [Clostridium botulinum]KOC58283.1 nucleotide pyrophosphohydrolase [Clostridium botulinum]
MIKIVGLGPGSKDAITIGTLDILKNSENVYFRTEIHPNVEYLKRLGVDFESYDNKYESSEAFDEVYESIAKDLIEKHKIHRDLVYAVPGHPLVAEKSVNILLQLCENNGIEVRILPAISFIDAMMESLKLDPVNGVKVIDAFDIKNQILDKRVGTVITQVYNKFIASEVKLALLEYYRDDMDIYFVRAAGVEGLESIRRIHLYELDRQEDIDYLTSIYIPRNINVATDFQDLLDIMEQLRGENGCPWDKEQDHNSLKRSLIEECYEVIDAIEKEDDENLVEELGDILLQVVFHAQIGKEEGYFNINDIIRAICDKLIKRHPHVFGNLGISDATDVLKNWDEIKHKEKGFVTYTDELKHISKCLPALIRAEKIQKKAAKVGFDWDNIEPALNKVLEEYEEVKDVYKSHNKEKIIEEVGDLIFSVVNVARFLDIDPENALNYTIDKFISRFYYIENKVKKLDKDITEMSLEELDNFWEMSKEK